jgi:hypothetical protein
MNGVNNPVYLENTFDVNNAAGAIERASGFRFMHDDNLGGGSWRSYGAEVLLYDGSLSDEDRISVVNALKTKWGICVEPSNYVADVLADGPMGYWQLNDLGDTAVDSSGNGRDGTYVFSTGVQQATGPFGVDDCAVDTTAGIGNYITIGDTAFDSIIGGVDQSWTFELWVNNPTNDVLEALIDKTDTSPVNWNIMQALVAPNLGKVSAQTFDGSSNPFAVSDDSLIGTGWHHIAMTRATLNDGDSADEIRIYVDGILEGVAPAAGSMDTTNTTDLTIGGRAEGADRTLVATYAHAAVYASALTATRLLSHFTTGTTGP